MTDITKLAKIISEGLYEWMSEVKTNCPSGTLLSSAVLCDYAGKRGFINSMTAHISTYIEAALAEYEWTEITDDPGTLPPAGIPIMTIHMSWDGAWHEQNVFTPLPTHWMYDTDHVASDRMIGTWWRKLGPLDRPPKP